MVVYLSANIVCSEKRTKAKTVSFEEQIRDKYTRMFSSQMEASMFSIPQIHFFRYPRVSPITSFAQEAFRP